jgi:hypothetical protein
MTDEKNLTCMQNDSPMFTKYLEIGPEYLFFVDNRTISLHVNESSPSEEGTCLVIWTC